VTRLGARGSRVLLDPLARNGRVQEARSLFERIAGLANELGLLAEEYDVPRARQVGNFPAGVQPPHPDPRRARDYGSRGRRELTSSNVTSSQERLA
jgi:hypothetical protein